MRTDCERGLAMSDVLGFRLAADAVFVYDVDAVVGFVFAIDAVVGLPLRQTGLCLFGNLPVVLIFVPQGFDSLLTLLLVCPFFRSCSPYVFDDLSGNVLTDVVNLRFYCLVDNLPFSRLVFLFQRL